MYIRGYSALGQSADASTPAQTTTSDIFQQLQNALASGHWYLALSLAVLGGVRDENHLTNMIFFARHPERGGRKLEKSEPGFTALSQEWLDIRKTIVRPYLAKSSTVKPTPKPSTGPTPKPAPGSLAYPEINTALPGSGAGFVRKGKTPDRSYGLPETIQALTEIAQAWHKKHPNGPRIVISDISPQGGRIGRFEPHSSHRVGLDIDLRLENGRSTWKDKVKQSDGTTQWVLNATYSKALTQDLADVFNNYKSGALKVKFILFDDPQITGVKKDKSSPHNNHFHVRFCAPTYFAAKVDKRYKSCS